MNPDPRPVLNYGIAERKPLNPVVRFAILIVCTIIGFVMLIAGLVMLLDDHNALPIRISGGAALMVVFGTITYLIISSYAQKRHDLAASGAAPAVPLTRKQKIICFLAGCVFWAAWIALKLFAERHE
jgi:hypothetical protein